MTYQEYIEMTEKRIQAESELLANLKNLHQHNLELQKQIDNGNSDSKTP